MQPASLSHGGEPTPPAPWLRGDPGDSLYRAAREALDRRDYRKAADLFAQVSARYPALRLRRRRTLLARLLALSPGQYASASRGAAVPRGPAAALSPGGHPGRRRRARAQNSGRARPPGRSRARRRTWTPWPSRLPCRRCPQPAGAAHRARSPDAARRRPSRPARPMATTRCARRRGRHQARRAQRAPADGRRARPADSPAGAGAA